MRIAAHHSIPRNAFKPIAHFCNIFMCGEIEVKRSEAVSHFVSNETCTQFASLPGLPCVNSSIHRFPASTNLRAHSEEKNHFLCSMPGDLSAHLLWIGWCKLRIIVCTKKTCNSCHCSRVIPMPFHVIKYMVGICTVLHIYEYIVISSMYREKYSFNWPRRCKHNCVQFWMWAFLGDVFHL